jgi:diguanylate cyclase (GGDEF)-like protein/PAS domain S-box-containing protein
MSKMNDNKPSTTPNRLPTHNEASFVISDDERLKQLKRKYDEIVAQVENLLGETIDRSSQIFLDAEVSNLIASQVFNASNDGIWAIDNNYKVMRVNNKLLDLLHKKAEEVIGHNCQEFFTEVCSNHDQCPRERIFKGTPIVYQERAFTSTSGDKIIFMVTFTQLSNLEGTAIGMVETFTDITERKRAEQELQQAYRKLELLASEDGLTKLPNRRSFDECFEKEWRRHMRIQKPISLIMCDVDYFKKYNDNYGHQAGDDCLATVGNVIGNNIKIAGHLPARYGGEEFAIIMPETSAQEAWSIAEKIRQELIKIQIPHEYSSAASYVTISCGIAFMYPNSNCSPKDLIKKADQGLYSANPTSATGGVLIL